MLNYFTFRLKTSLCLLLFPISFLVGRSRSGQPELRRRTHVKVAGGRNDNRIICMNIKHASSSSDIEINQDSTELLLVLKINYINIINTFKHSENVNVCKYVVKKNIYLTHPSLGDR